MSIRFIGRLFYEFIAVIYIIKSIVYNFIYLLNKIIKQIISLLFFSKIRL